MKTINESYMVYDLSDVYKELDYFCQTFGWEMYITGTNTLEIYHKSKGVKISIVYAQYDNFDSYKSFFTFIDPANIQLHYNAKDDFFALLNNVKGFLVLYR